MSTFDMDATLSCAGLVTYPGSQRTDRHLWNDPAERQRVDRWRILQDELLRWRMLDSAAFERGRQPSSDVIDGAIDFAIDCIDEGMQPPTAAAPSADGGIAFEWRQGGRALHIEVLQRGRIEVLHLDGARVLGSHVMVRTPLTRGRG